MRAPVSLLISHYTLSIAMYRVGRTAKTIREVFAHSRSLSHPRAPTSADSARGSPLCNNTITRVYRTAGIAFLVFFFFFSSRFSITSWSRARSIVDRSVVPSSDYRSALTSRLAPRIRSSRERTRARAKCCEHRYPLTTVASRRKSKLAERIDRVNETNRGSLAIPSRETRRDELRRSSAVRGIRDCEGERNYYGRK